MSVPPPLIRTVARWLPAPARRVARRLWDRRPEPFGAWVGREGGGASERRAATYRAVWAAGGVRRAHDGSVLVAGYAQALAVLRDSETYSSESRAEFGPILVGYDGPTHRAIRAALVPALSSGALGGRGAWVRDVARELLREMATRGERDLAAGLATPLVLRLLADLVGLARVPTAELIVWGPHIRRFSREGFTEGSAPDEAFRAAAADLWLRARAGETPALGLSQIDHVAHSEDAFARGLAVLFYAGLFTTRMTIVSTCYALLDYPDVEVAVRADRSRVSDLVDEVLRLKTTEFSISRDVTRPTTLAGHALEPGCRVWVLLEAVNRDPAVFDAPDTLRLGRRGGRHLTFGFGPHFCPGHFWAREEIEGAIDVVLDAWPSLQAAVVPFGGRHLDRFPDSLLMREGPRI